LQMPHVQASFHSLHIPVLHRIAFSVVSEWCLYHPPIRMRLGTREMKFYISISTCAMLVYCKSSRTPMISLPRFEACPGQRRTDRP
jgi:hypothetical protein